MKHKNMAALLVGLLVASLAGATIIQPSAARSNKYFCAQLGGVYKTFVRTYRGPVAMISWVNSFDPQWPRRRRCIEVSKRFQRFSDNGLLKFIGTGEVNRLPVLCVVRDLGDGCSSSNVLVTLRQGMNPQRTAQQLLDLRGLAASGRTVPLSGDRKLETYDPQKRETYYNIDVFLEVAPVVTENLTAVE